MYFAIGTVEFFEKIGYNTKYWRKSSDETLTICHLEYAEILTGNLTENPEVEIVDISKAKEIINSEKWVHQYNFVY